VLIHSYLILIFVFSAAFIFRVEKGMGKITRSPLQLMAAFSAAIALSACDSRELAVDSKTHTRATGIHDSFDMSKLILRAAAALHSDNGNLLIDGSFESQSKSGWDNCGSENKIRYTHDASDGGTALKLRKQGCVYQGMRIERGALVSLVCDAKISSKRNDWTGLGISFYDEHWNYLEDAPYTEVNSYQYSTYEVTEQAPASAVYASVWFYTENKALLDNCFLNTEEAESPNLLYNGDFTIDRPGYIRDEFPVTQADGWRDACGGVNLWVSSNPNGEMVLSEGACVHQQLSNDAIDALRGNYFELTCTYRQICDAKRV